MADEEDRRAASSGAMAARSWLFVPGDSERKLANSLRSGADIVIIDLEDAVAADRKREARAAARDFLLARGEDRTRPWVRINVVPGRAALDDLAAVMPARPGGVMLPKVRGRRDVETLDHFLSALEVAHGIAEGATPVIALITETAEAMSATGNYGGAPRLAAVTWGAEDLADALGASGNREADGSYAFTYALARSLTLIGAAAAQVPAIETIFSDFKDMDGLRACADKARRDGFSGMLAIHPAQVPIINAAFTPSAVEVAEAQEIVDLFAASPGSGVIGRRGTMLDRPHLARALRLLAQAERGGG